MTTDISQNIEIPVLGRAFRLGTLYNYHKDEIVSGFNLWDLDVINNNVTPVRCPKIVLKEIKEGTNKQQTEALGMDEADKLDYLVKKTQNQISGAATILDHNASSVASNRRILHYSCRTESRELNMAHLAHAQILHTEGAIKDADATHAVVRVIYGGDAFFILENDEDHKPGFVSEKAKDLQHASRKMQNIQRHKKVTHDEYIIPDSPSPNITCRYYGDFNIGNTLKTYEEAAKDIYDIYRLQENPKDVVPKTVILQPLYAICPSVSKVQLVEVDELLEKKANRILESLGNATDRATAIASTDSLCYKYIPSARKSLDEFRDAVDVFRTMFRRELLPYRRNASVDAAGQDALRKLVEDFQSNRFKEEVIKRWLDKKAAEVRFLATLLEKAHTLISSGLVIVTNKSEFHAVLMDAHFPNYLGFQMCICQDPDEYVEDLKNECDKLDVKLRKLSPSPSVNSCHRLPEYWVDDIGKCRSLRNQLSNFLALAEASSGTKKYGFVLGSVKFDPHADRLYSVWLHEGDENSKEVALPLVPEIDRIHQLTGFDDHLKQTTHVEVLWSCNAQVSAPAVDAFSAFELRYRPDRKEFAEQEWRTVPLRNPTLAESGKGWAVITELDVTEQDYEFQVKGAGSLSTPWSRSYQTRLVQHPELL